MNKKIRIVKNKQKKEEKQRKLLGISYWKKTIGKVNFNKMLLSL